MEADVIIGEKGASVEQTFEEHSSVTGTDIQLFSQNSFSSLYQASAKQSHHGYVHASTLPRVNEAVTSQHGSEGGLTAEFVRRTSLGGKRVLAGPPMPMPSNGQQDEEAQQLLSTPLHQAS